MDLFSDMTVFVEVVRANSFTQGAHNLGMPASTVSRRISELEKRLGLRLLTRTTRRISLTDVGEVYYGRCRRLVEEARLAQEELNNTLQHATGLLKVSLPADFAKYQLTSLILAFAKAHPKVRFKLDLSPNAVDLTRDPFDLAIRIGEQPDSGLISRRITALTVSLFASPHYSKETASLRAPAGLNTHQILAMREGAWVLHNTEGESQTIPVEPIITANSVGMLIRLATANGGIAPLPQLLVQDLVDKGELVPVLPNWTFKPLPVYAITETRLLPAKTRLFIDFLVKQFAVKKHEGV